MIIILHKTFCFLRLHYYLLLWSIHRTYYAAIKMFKKYDSTTVDSNDDEDQKVLAVKLIGSSLVKQQIVKNITGLHNAKFRIISPLIVHCDFIP